MATLAERYVFGEHARPGSANCRLITELGLVDYLADRFAIVGTPAECVKKLERAIEAGARQFWMSIHFDDKFRLIRDFAEQVMPCLPSRAARGKGRPCCESPDCSSSATRIEAANVASAERLCERPRRAGPRSPACPELFNTMYFCVETKPEYFDWAEPVPGPTTERMGALARELGIVVIAPIFERAPDGRYFNAAAVLGPDGRCLGKYRKSSIPFMDVCRAPSHAATRSFTSRRAISGSRPSTPRSRASGS